jgi:PKD domain
MNRSKASSGLVGALLAVAVALLAGCGDSGSHETAAASNPPAANLPPTANAGPDQLVLAGTAMTLSGSGSDSDGTISTYAWVQSSGTAVTLSAANTATAGFTAPTTAGALEFRLTVTDNQGATNSDLVTVMVNVMAAPVIARQPTSPLAHEHGVALMFVVAAGANLDYEWRRTSGTVMKSGPEPFFARATGAGLGMSSDGDCFVVVVSNAAGSVTSEPGCLTVIPAVGHFDLEDDDPLDDYSIAEGYGNALLWIARTGAGAITGSTMFIDVPRLLGPGNNCPAGGAYLGGTLDGVALTAVTAAPLGQHTYSEIWDNCEGGDPDRMDDILRGGVLVSYDFPNKFGEGTMTMYLSGWGEGNHVLNGRLTVTTTPGVDSFGRKIDDILITVLEDFSAGAATNRSAAEHTIEMHRRRNDAGTHIVRTELSFHLPLSVYDEDGYVGTAYQSAGGSLNLNHEPDVGDDGTPSHTSDSRLEMRLGASHFNPGSGQYLGTVKAVQGNGGWVLNVDEPEEPEDPVVD